MIAAAKPGSHDAVEAGCTCPVLDNHHGHGFVMGGERAYWIAENCPLHGAKKESKKAEDVRKTP